MKFNQFRYLAVFIVPIALLSCKDEVKKTTKEENIIVESSIKYAEGFRIQEFDGYKKLIISAPYQNSEETFEFILSQNPTNTDLNTIKTPVESVVVTSTTHIPMLELLQVEDKLVGYPNTKYISSKKTRNLIDSDKILDLGNEENINTELLLDLNPDLVIGFSINSNNKMFATIKKMGIPIILNGAWLEKTPLGRAEWIKVFGVLFNKEKEADSIFNTIENN
ncbi:MAG: ABC transporter substrate-binding protein, partial [Bacteroidetes bacterium]|nr:ABC transporter substrate-binding protein [Bacteroidota bacterium]